jgi:hypothetical protein
VNVSDERDVQLAKHSRPIISTEGEMQIDCNDEQPQNAWASIVVSFESDPNVNDEREAQLKKHS